MTFHRTCGKGGTRNSARERHIDEYAPNFNKRQGSGANPRGRKKNNPTKADDTGGRAAARHRMMLETARDPGATEKGRRPVRSKFDQWLGGKSGITDF